ncbi:protein toll-like [Plakobranchus ocellatus]|uniref:Protein toll-like n=1 Tax=Plakobranchus ocellatus TaxID=259542 RepID=A0AAV4E175_9GAST|nr:protein toll-like [Plakobranchus ocellatus]
MAQTKHRSSQAAQAAQKNTITSKNICFSILLLTMIQRLDACQACPRECACATIEHIIMVNCSFRKLTSFPSLLDLAPPVDHHLTGRTLRGIHLFVNGNSLRYVLRNQLSDVASQLNALEIENNKHFMELPSDLFTGFGSLGGLQRLRLGPIRGNICGIINSLNSLSQIRDFSLTGSISAYKESKSIPGTENCVLDSAALPSTLRFFHLAKWGTVTIEGEAKSDLALIDLKLSGLRLVRVPLLAIKLLPSSLRHLDLSRNLITDLKHYPVPTGMRHCRLETLNLSYNRLSVLKDGMLEKCTSLRLLDVSHNPFLLSLGPDLLPKVTALTLDLSFTRVSSLEAIALDQTTVVKMFSAGLECDCERLANMFLTRIGGKTMIHGTCHHSGREVQGQRPEVTLEQFIFECSVNSEDPTTASILSHMHQTMREYLESGELEQETSKHERYTENVGNNTEQLSNKQTGGTAIKFCPFSCCTCFVASIIHGLLLCAALLTIGEGVKKYDFAK